MGPATRVLLLGMALLSGCRAAVRPAAEPLDPVASESAFHARSLGDPAFHTFACARLPCTAAFPPPAWDLASLSLAALFFHPSLAEARARVAEAEAAELTAGARPNPTLDFSPGRVLGAVTGGSPWTLGFALGVPIETAGKRGTRVLRARLAADAAKWQMAEAAWGIRGRLRAALLELLLAVRGADLAQREAGLRESYRSLVAKRFEVGEASRPDVSGAEAEASSARAAAARASGGVAEARTRLAAAVGLPTAALDAVEIAWPTFESPPRPEAVPLAEVRRAGLLHRLDVRRSLAEYAEAEAALQVEVAKQYPDVRLGPGYTWDQGENKIALGLSVTLPVFDRNEGPIAEALARRRESAAKFLAIQAGAIAQTESATAAFAAARRALDAAEDLVARLAQREEAARRSTEAGEEDALFLAGIRVQRVAAERERLDALRRAQEALGALEDAVQRPLSDDPSAPTLGGPPQGGPK